MTTVQKRRGPRTLQALAFEPLHAHQAAFKCMPRLCGSGHRPGAPQLSLIQLNDCLIDAAGYPERLLQLALTTMVLGRRLLPFLCLKEALGELQLIAGVLGGLLQGLSHLLADNVVVHRLVTLRPARRRIWRGQGA